MATSFFSIFLVYLSIDIHNFKQVKQSLNTSLKNLRTNYLDSLVMHSPLSSYSKTLSVWRTFESFHDQGTVKSLGISNIYDLQFLKQLWNEARVKPAIVQNRFYADTEYDQGIRAFCQSVGIHYQSFWTLTANPHVLGNRQFRNMAARYHATQPQLFYRFVMALGICPLSGTTDDLHMEQDMEVTGIPMTSEDVEEVKKMMSIAN